MDGGHSAAIARRTRRCFRRQAPWCGSTCDCASATPGAKDGDTGRLHGGSTAPSTYEPSRPFEPWLFAIARRVVARRHGERTVRDARERLVHVLPEVAVDGDGLAKLGLEQALSRLSPAQREALTLLKLDGLSIEAAAPRAGTTVGALKVRAHRAYRTLRRFL
jgi:DNA-directed RNA polymerase specialized sigma24 family protein